MQIWLIQFSTSNGLDLLDHLCSLLHSSPDPNPVSCFFHFFYRIITIYTPHPTSWLFPLCTPPLSASSIFPLTSLSNSSPSPSSIHHHKMNSVLYYAGSEELDSHNQYQPHFLDSCFLCQRPLAHNCDIFMYRLAKIPSMFFFFQYVFSIFIVSMYFFIAWWLIGKLGFIR